MDSQQDDLPFRILQIISNLEIGGAQEVVRTLSANIRKCGHSIVVCSFKDGPLRKDIERMGIPVEIIKGRSHSIISPVQFGQDILRVRKDLSDLIARYQIDVVQTHLLRSLDFLILSLKTRHPNLLVFWTVHNSQFTLRADQLASQRWLLRPKRLAHRLLYLASANIADGFIAVSEEVGQSILTSIGPVKKRVTVISNGVDTLRYQPGLYQESLRGEIRRSFGLAYPSRLILVVGTLKEQKGHRYLIEAVAPLVKQDPDLHLVFAGDGVLRRDLEDQVTQAGISESVHFLGNRQDVPALLASADIFVLPSLWEGLPMALIEAMAAGLPVVATRVSGSLQVIMNRETGLLVSPGDPDQLRKAIGELLSDPVRATKMGLAARAYIEKHFGARKQAEEHLRLFKREWKNRYPHAIR